MLCVVHSAEKIFIAKSAYVVEYETLFGLTLDCKLWLVIIILLWSGQFDPMSKNARDKTPMKLVPQNHKNRFEVFKMFEPFQQSQADFPVESYR